MPFLCILTDFQERRLSFAGKQTPALSAPPALCRPWPWPDCGWPCAFSLPWLLPFLLAFSLAALLEPAVRLLMERLHLPRRGAAALCTAALTAAVLGGLALVVWRVGYELSLLLGRLPTLLAGLPTLADGLERWAYRFLIALPVQFQTLARDALEGLLEQSIALPNRFYDALAGAVTGLASALPSPPLFFLFTTVLATL